MLAAMTFPPWSCVFTKAGHGSLLVVGAAPTRARGDRGRAASRTELRAFEAIDTAEEGPVSRRLPCHPCVGPSVAEEAK